MNQKIYKYSLGYAGQGAAYNFMSTYFIVFMTDCVGISSGLSGLIMALALLTEVGAGMVIGNLSDHCCSRWGKRRPFVLAAAVTMPIILLLLFREIEAAVPVTFSYYLMCSVLFRLSFSAYEIPYSAFGAEIASGYDERTRLRTTSRICGIAGNTVAYVTPLLVLDCFAQQKTGWSIAALIIAVACFASWMAAFLLTEETVPEEALRQKKERRAPAENNVIKEIAFSYVQLVKLRPMRILIVYKAAFACALALFNVGTIYYMKYCAGMSNSYISGIYFITIAVFLLTTPLINRMALHLGKSRQQMIMLGAAGIVGLAVYLLFCGSVAGAVIYVLFFAAAQNSFWQLSPSLFYDIVEVDEFVNGTRREGDIMSFVSVLGTLVTALIVQMFGVCFDASGYSALKEVQGAETVAFLSLAYVLVPSICFLAGAAALKAFPIDKGTFTSLSAAVALKKKGEAYSAYAADLEKILK